MDDSKKLLSVELPAEVLLQFEVCCGMVGRTEKDVLTTCISDFIEKNHYHEFDPFDATPEELELYQQVVSLKYNYFDDMSFQTESIVGKYVNLADGSVYPDLEKLQNIDWESYTFCVGEFANPEFLASFTPNTKTLKVSEKCLAEDYVLLHELIHIHEHILDTLPAYYRDILTLSLYNDLSPKLKKRGNDLDAMLASFCHVVNEVMIESAGGTHSPLFFLKSLDIDLRRGYPLGRVLSYGWDEKLA